MLETERSSSVSTEAMDTSKTMEVLKRSESPQQQQQELQYEPNMLPDLLPVYYKRLFPHKAFYRWLSYGQPDQEMLSHREISFTLHDDIYIRYLSFESQAQLERDICSKVPYKIDLGAVMSCRPRTLMPGTSMEPVERELVFDIDLTDYDDVRTCCSGASVCIKCWKFMVVAVRILETALRDDFGFEHIMWVFSGRRGIHCWVCDYNARTLDTVGRSAVAEYLQIITHIMQGGNNVSRIHMNGDRMHHSIKRALKFIEPVFEEIVLEDQDAFGTPKGVTLLTQLIPDEMARKEMTTYLNTLKDGVHSREIWAAFVRYANSMRTGGSGSASIWGRRLKYIIEEVQLIMLYPRLDINVTRGFNHLLKAPFCIHPGTGKVCLPFAASAAAKFDPVVVPNIVQLLQEINAFDDKMRVQDNDEMGVEKDSITIKNRIKDYKKTGMFKGMLVFEEFLRRMESSFAKKATEINDQKMQF